MAKRVFELFVSFFSKKKTNIMPLNTKRKRTIEIEFDHSSSFGLVCWY